MTRKKFKSLPQIKERIIDIANEINIAYDQRDVEIVLINSTPIFFLNELLQHIKFRYKVQFLTYQNYTNEHDSCGEVQILQDLIRPIHNKDVLLIEGVIISGKTPDFIHRLLQSRNPNSVAFACIGHKSKLIAYELPPLFSLFDFSNQWIEGFGIGDGPDKNKLALYNLK